MTLAAGGGPHSSRATPFFHDTHRRHMKTTTRRRPTYPWPNAVQPNWATSHDTLGAAIKLGRDAFGQRGDLCDLHAGIPLKEVKPSGPRLAAGCRTTSVNRLYGLHERIRFISTGRGRLAGLHIAYHRSPLDVRARSSRASYGMDHSWLIDVNLVA